MEFFFFFSDVPGGGEGDGEGELGRGRVDGLAEVEGLTRALRTLVGQFEDETGAVLFVEREARRKEAWRGREEKATRERSASGDEKRNRERSYSPWW